MSKEEFELEFSERSKKKRFGSAATWQYLGLIGEIGFAICLPIAGGAMVGVVIDRTWSTSPKATLSLLFLGIIVSFINLFKTVETVIRNKK
ncbi:AtpZ/AtpI family protein [Candidatus Gottesmanbacteria bacterium]|nr:AtpZ/AtpI family protein [Candidatus Gottesmanbacteria bacterium]